jgi:hypothetical protein
MMKCGEEGFYSVNHLEYLRKTSKTFEVLRPILEPDAMRVKMNVL